MYYVWEQRLLVGSDIRSNIWKSAAIAQSIASWSAQSSSLTLVLLSVKFVAGIFLHSPHIPRGVVKRRDLQWFFYWSTTYAGIYLRQRSNSEKKLWRQTSRYFGSYKEIKIAQTAMHTALQMAGAKRGTPSQMADRADALWQAFLPLSHVLLLNDCIEQHVLLCHYGNHLFIDNISMNCNYIFINKNCSSSV